MRKDKMHRLRDGAAVIGLGLAIAGCARNTAQNPPPPPASTQSALDNASTVRQQWSNPIAGKPGTRYATTNIVHLRSSPGVNGPVIGTLPTGTPVRATGSEQGGWWEVRTPDGTGWVGSRFLSPS